RGVKIVAHVLAIDVHPEAYPRARIAYERQRGFQGSVRRQPKHEAGGTTSQAVLDAEGVPLGRKARRPFSKRRKGYAAKRRLAIVAGIVGVAGALLRGHPGRRNVLSMGCEYSGKLVT